MPLLMDLRISIFFNFMRRKREGEQMLLHEAVLIAFLVVLDISVSQGSHRKQREHEKKWSKRGNDNGKRRGDVRLGGIKIIGDGR